MDAVNTPIGHQLIGHCGKGRNHHALGWQVEPVETDNRQKIQILSFRPRSPGGVESATWRPPLLSRVLSPRFLIGAPPQHGGVGLTQSRRLRDSQFQVRPALDHSRPRGAATGTQPGAAALRDWKPHPDAGFQPWGWHPSI